MIDIKRLLRNINARANYEKSGTRNKIEKFEWKTGNQRRIANGTSIFAANNIYQ